MTRTGTGPAVGTGLSGQLVEEAGALDAVREEWDALAASAGRPYCTPAWMLSWWHAARVGDARLRVVVVRDGSEVVAIAPFFAQVSRPAGLRLVELRLLGAGGAHRIGPLCRPGREGEAAQAITDALAASRPRPSSVVFEGIDVDDPWPRLLAARWPAPARAALRRDNEMSAPVANLGDGTYEAFFAGRSSKYRAQMRRARRSLEADGLEIRRTHAPEQLERDLEAFVALHEARWAERGGSHALDAGVVALLRRVADDLLGSGRFRLWLVEVGGAAIGAGLFVAAGDVVSFWGGGMDPAHKRASPAQLAILAGIEECYAQGEHVVDFGGGGLDYKWRFCDTDEPVVWSTVFPRDARYPLTRLQLAPKHLRYGARNAARRLPPERQQQLRRLLRR